MTAVSKPIDVANEPRLREGLGTFVNICIPYSGLHHLPLTQPTHKPVQVNERAYGTQRNCYSTLVFATTTTTTSSIQSQEPDALESGKQSKWGADEQREDLRLSTKGNPKPRLETENRKTREIEMADTVETTELNGARAIADAIAGPDSDVPVGSPPLSAAQPKPADARAVAATEPIFPLLHNHADADPDSPAPGAPLLSRPGVGPVDDNDDDEPAVARPFIRTSSPDPAAPETTDDDDDDRERVNGGPAAGTRSRAIHKMHKFSLYETASRFYIVGGDVTEKRYRILKIDRTANDASELSIIDDKTIYTQKDMNQLLDTIDDGNKGTGGLKLRCTTWGLLGFVKFTGPYYMMLITKKSTVAMIGGHYVYQIDGTDLIPLTSPSFKTDQRNTEESRFLGILHNLDLTRSFYYSYSYDITRTLQHNITRERTALLSGQPCPIDDDLNSMFVWNNHLLQPAARTLSAPYDWCRPIIHGYIDQAAVSVYGRTAHITIIARRSRYFAGARFLKRGANDLGYVANDVETEQIVSEALTTSFHAPGPKFYASPAYTSYVQHRGSIPLYWTQDNTGVTPKPPIELNLVDPFYTAAAHHFDNLFDRYGVPVYVLNLVKARERTPRESKLLDEFTRAIEYLNQFLPADRKILYKAWDMSRAAKSRDQDVIGTLESIAESVLSTTGFFRNGDGHISPIQVQNGVARTNCIDCLDRTNAAQFVIGKRALGHQLHALGILEDTSISYDTDAVNLFTHMYHDHGDTIAVQYGGSQLVNTMETYRKINQWTSHSRDMIESFKRYYNNSFLDGQRQEAYNLFLGNYIFAKGQPMLWDLATDYYLHHEDPRTWLGKPNRHYINWYTPKFLEERVIPPYPAIHPGRAAHAAPTPVSCCDDYWLEYYRPSTLSSFLKMFPYKMNSTIKYIPFKSTQDGRYDLSPFRVRNETDGEAAEKKKAKKEVTILAPHDLTGIAGEAEANDKFSVSSSPSASSASGRGISLQRWLQPSSHDNHVKNHSNTNGATHGIMKEHAMSPLLHNNSSDPDAQYKTKATALEKSRAAQWTFTQVVHESLNPTVSSAEAEDYARYISHPQNLPLVVSAEIAASEIEPEYQEYVNGSWQQPEGLVGSSETPGHEDDHTLYVEMLKIGENPLTVTEEDALKKRYKAYRKWLRGKSLFKQQPVD
ncbi:SacI homology domain-containing protein [Apodospora peruviana]|uniref:SacI homology domain-containing protein n=1 Tax=Apodospora peruviana TaxID=516989 RepID=A0AAE0I505_9PEZI|nr:SacI homology domain-containing protein [Apodospora peruviana]